MFHVKHKNPVGFSLYQNNWGSPRDAERGYMASNTQKITDGLWLNQLNSRVSSLAQLRNLLQICSGEHNELNNELWFTIQEEDDDIILS